MGLFIDTGDQKYMHKQHNVNTNITFESVSHQAYQTTDCIQFDTQNLKYRNKISYVSRYFNFNIKVFAIIWVSANFAISLPPKPVAIYFLVFLKWFLDLEELRGFSWNQ